MSVRLCFGPLPGKSLRTGLYVDTYVADVYDATAARLGLTREECVGRAAKLLETAPDRDIAAAGDLLRAAYEADLDARAAFHRGRIKLTVIPGGKRDP